MPIVFLTRYTHKKTMSYHIYTTDGIVLKRQVFGEANILLHILTTDLGLIIASARSARLSASKLKGALQEYQHISVSCVKGKNGWKITNVSDKESFFFNYPEHSRRVLAQVTSLLLQMITGESPHPEIFKTVKTGFEFLKNVDGKDIPSFETLIVLRILHKLGYVATTPETAYFLAESELWSSSILEQTRENKENLTKLINKALKESHL